MTRFDIDPDTMMSMLVAGKQQQDFISFCNAIGWECRSLYCANLTLVEMMTDTPEELVHGYKNIIHAILTEQSFTMQDDKKFEAPVYMFIELLLVLTFKQNLTDVENMPFMSYFFELIRNNVREAVMSNISERDKELINKWIKD